MLQLARNSWRSLSFLMAVFGLFWLPKDVQDYHDAAEPWRKALAMIDQNLALWVLVAVLGSWLLWTDARPYIASYRRKHRPIKIREAIFCESDIVDGVYRDHFYLVVENDLKDRRTLRNVAASFSLVGAPLPLFVHRTDQTNIDLRHGELALFEIGTCISFKPTGLPRIYDTELSAQEKAEAEHNLKNGHRSLQIGRDGNNSLANPAGMKLGDFPFYITVSADDVPASIAKVRMDLRNLPDLHESFKLEINLE